MKINLLALRLGHVLLRPHREGIALELWESASDVYMSLLGGSLVSHQAGRLSLPSLSRVLGSQQVDFARVPSSPRARY